MAGERKLSCVSVEVDEVNFIESVEELEAVQEIIITECSSLTDEEVSLTAGVVDPNALIPGGSGDYFKLESVTEETEEELKADGSGRSPQVRRNRLTDSLLNTNQTQSLTDLPPIPPKRVGILKRAGAKKDRPLSDSFENLKMVENQGIIDMYHGQQSLSPSPPPLLIMRGHSLDALMDRPDSETQSPLTSSQVSLAERFDSQDSLTGGSDYGDSSPKLRSRSNSGKLRSSSMVYSNRAPSLSLSLNDVQHISRTSSTSSTEDFHHPHNHNSKKKNASGSSLFSRFQNGKKAKSMSALDHEENNLLSEAGE